MRVLHVTAELYPWVKSGGLGDVAAALPPALAALDVDARLLLPGFSGFLDAFAGITDIARLPTPFAAERVRVARAWLPRSELYAYLVDHPPFYDRPGNPYAAPDGSDWSDNHLRFGLFSWVAAALAGGVDPTWRPDILHCHDWHGGLAPAYLAASLPAAERARTVLTIHNLAYRGIFPSAVFSGLALPPEFFSINGVEFYGQVSFLKAGLYFADHVTTVSPTYAREIQTPDFGWGLDGLLRTRAAQLTGILNGADPRVWDPRHDANLPQAYGVDDALAGKRVVRAALCRRMDLTVTEEAPLYGVVSRLTPQKGLDLLLASLPQFVARGARLALLGSGDADLEQGFAAAARAHRGRVAVELGYNDELAHLIIGGADMIIMPSRFEPCGLAQLYALRYGTLPLVRRVGGLADTVVDASAVTLADGSATGFAFDGLSPAALLEAAARATDLMRQPIIWQRLVRRAMTRDFSWDAAASRYLALYHDILDAGSSEPSRLTTPAEQRVLLGGARSPDYLASSSAAGVRS